MADQALAQASGQPGRLRQSEIEILHEASDAVATHSLDNEALMDALARVVREIVDYELYALLIPDEDGELRVAHSVGYSEELVRTLRIPMDQGLTGRAARTMRTVCVDDVTRDPTYVRAIDSVRSEVAVPLVARGRVVAVLDLQSAHVNAFGRQVSDLLALVSSRFSLALDVAQLYQMQAQQHSTLRTLQEIAQEFSQILHLDDLLRKIATLVRTLISYDVLAIYLKDPTQALLRHYFGVKFEERVRWRDIRVGEGLVGSAASTNQPVLVAETDHDPRYIASVPGIRSEVAVPLLLKNELIGVLDLESVRPACFRTEDVDTLTLLAPQIAAAIENARLYEEKARNEARLEHDLVAARAMQRHLLPEGLLSGPGIEIAARNEPATEVSGDFYDFFYHGKDVGILNGDVSGKGAAAALYAALASGLIRSAATEGLAPGELLGRINDSLADRKIEAKFLAAFVARWQAAQRTLRVSGAGMPFPFVLTKGELIRIPLKGIPLGLFYGTEYEESTLVLEPGDFAVSVSDGFNDSYNRRGESYGEDHVARVLLDHRGRWTIHRRLPPN